MTAAATSPLEPHPYHASTAWINDVATRILRLLNTGPEVNAATAGPVHLVGIPDDAEDSGSSVVQDQEESGRNKPSHAVLFFPSSELLTPPIPENTSFAAPVQEASHAMTSSPLPPDGAQSSVRRESITNVTGAHPAQEQQLAFLVKASDLSVNGMLALNGASAAALHLWIFQKNSLGDESKSVCEHIGWQTCISLAPFVMYLLTVWVTSMTKAIEKAIEKASTTEEANINGLNVISGFVLAFFVWPVLMGGLMTHCMTRAAIWIVLLVETPLILIMFIIWGATFSHPKILRRCFCSWCNCSEVAAAQDADGDLA